MIKLSGRAQGTAIQLPDELAHVSADDIINVSSDGRRITVVWKCTAAHNSLLLTEQCDNCCLMCSQPPKTRDDFWLSNGRRFADFGFAARYAGVGNPDIMVGIPIYAAEPGRHDFVVQSGGAFDDTIHGILALMGLEMTGLARPNSAEVWIDPADYQAELSEAAHTLAGAHIATRIYNHQLCVLDRTLWPFAVRAISDWKNDYLDICQECAVRQECGGVFTTSGQRLSQHLRPIMHE
jgi:hypothetical protein